MYGVTPWTRLSSGKGPVQTTAARTIRGPDRLGAEKGQRAACPALFKVMWARWGWPQGQAKAWLKHWGVTRRGGWAAGVAPLQEVRAGTGAWGSCRPLGAPGPWQPATSSKVVGIWRLCHVFKDVFVPHSGVVWAELEQEMDQTTSHCLLWPPPAFPFPPLFAAAWLPSDLFSCFIEPVFNLPWMSHPRFWNHPPVFQRSCSTGSPSGSCSSPSNLC